MKALLILTIVLSAAAPLSAAEVTFRLAAGATQVADGGTVTVEVWATADTPLVAAAFSLTADGAPAATVVSRAAGPLGPAGLTLISTVSQVPFDAGLPHDLSAATLSEVLLDLDYGALPGGPDDGTPVGNEQLLDSVDVVLTGSGNVVISLTGLSAAYTAAHPAGRLFESIAIAPGGQSLTIHVGAGCPNAPGDLDGDGHVNLVDFTTFAVCIGAEQPTLDCPDSVFYCADLDASGSVGLEDFSTFSVLFGSRAAP